MASSRSRSYRRTHSQRLSSSGSRSGSPAFIGKSVLGRNSVALQSRPICGGRAIALATGADGFSSRALLTGRAFGLAGRVRVDFADLGLAAALADFGFDAVRLPVLAVTVLDFAVLGLAAGFTDFARAAALSAGLAARFGLAREEGFLLFSFAMSPCFRHYWQMPGATPRGVLATPPLIIQCRLRERAREGSAPWGRRRRAW